MATMKKKTGTCFKKGGRWGRDYQFMVTTCYAYVCAESNASLCSPSSSPNSFDGNSSNVRSTEGGLEIVINFQDDVSCGQDVMLKCNCIFTTNAMLQFGVVACACFNFGISKFVYMLGCPSFSTLSTSESFITWNPLECWSLDGDVKVEVDVSSLSCSSMLWNLSTTHQATFFDMFQACIL